MGEKEPLHGPEHPARQLELFSASQFQPSSEVQHPGQLPLKDWLSQPDTVYHASFRKNRDDRVGPDEVPILGWEEGPMAHVGTQGAASDRLVQHAVNIPPAVGSISAPVGTDDPRGGRLSARRLARPIAHTTKSDVALNTAESEIVHYNRPPEEVGKHAYEKDRPEIQEMAAHLRAGSPVAYRNSFEDVGKNSVLAPKGSLRAWHEDVTEAQSLGLDVHPQDANLAQQQFDPAISITPSSGGHNAETYTQRYNKSFLRTRQESFLPNYTYKNKQIEDPETGEMVEDPAIVEDPATIKHFEIRHDDPDWTGYKTDLGHDAGERAREHAKATGQEIGYNVDRGPFDWRNGPEALKAAHLNAVGGQTHLERAHHEVMDKKRPEQNAKNEERSRKFRNRNMHFDRGKNEMDYDSLNAARAAHPEDY